MKNVLQILILFSYTAVAQYSPEVGQDGCIAIPMDSPLFVSWAEQGQIERGWMNCADTSMSVASYGELEYAFGIPDPAVVSLGDAGIATFYFETNIYDGEGYDFAVFENSFDNNFLELAFVEVSSDGESFYRFPAVSLTQSDTQLGPFDYIETEKIHNLAGKYPSQWGTPFDLSDLSGFEDLNRSQISHIRIIDVVGSIDTLYASYDSQGRVINDPWPTAFESGGFDIDAIGIIHQNPLSIEEHTELLIYPNPVDMQSSLHLKSAHLIENIKLIDAIGRVQTIDFATEIHLPEHINFRGLYVLEYEILGKLYRQKIIIR